MEKKPIEYEITEELLEDAMRVVKEIGRASVITIQRRLRIGYGRAKRLIEIMDEKR